MTTGPWKPVSLHTYHVRIVEVDARIIVGEGLDAQLSTKISLSSSIDGSVQVDLKSPTGEIVRTNHLRADRTDCVMYREDFAAKEIELWYPIGYGKQPLYSLEVTLFDKVSQGLHSSCQ